LIFGGIQKNNNNGNKSPEVMETLLRQHLQSAFKVNKEMTDYIRFKRVQRSLGTPVAGKV
jgi:hypothetical protein